MNIILPFYWKEEKKNKKRKTKQRDSVHSIISATISFKLFNNYLFLCLHVLANSDSLFNDSLLSNDLIINSSSIARVPQV